MKGTVYVVHCIDTEGPLYEDKNVVFDQIKRIFGVDINNTEKNYYDLYNGKMDLGENTEGITTLVRSLGITTKGNWAEIEQMLNEITSHEYRHILEDSKGKGWIYSWFCMDHVGFAGENPRRRDAGYHRVFDVYKKLIETHTKDIVQFHHHPVSISGNFHDSGTRYWGEKTLNEILCRRIIDRKWFPCVYRPGFHTERPDSHWFLEQWIPFDYGNQATASDDSEQIDMMNGRFGNWKNAPREWVPYHPSHDNYQLKGNCRRWITRCLNMKARIREITEEDIEEAFKEAGEGRNVILAFTDHDYKDMKIEITRVRELIKKVSERYHDVPFEYKDALEAMRIVLNLQKEKSYLKAQIDKEHFPPRLIIECEEKIFGPQPFLAIKTKDDKYYWDNFDFIEEKKWSYTFDNNTIELEKIEEIGVATNTASGVTEIINYSCKDQIFDYTCLNY